MKGDVIGTSYLDFVDAVLQLICGASSGPDARPANLFALATSFESGRAENFFGKALHRALVEAFTDLRSMGLHDGSGRFMQARLAADGKHYGRVGLSAAWPGLVERLTLSDSARTVLAAACRICENRQADFCELLVTDSAELLAETGLQFAELDVAFRELKGRRAIDGKIYMGGRIGNIRPTYVGFVLATQTEAVTLQRTVDALVPDWEGATVDHKVQLHVDTQSEKAEATKDILALANTQVRGGRYLVTGFDDVTRQFKQSFDGTVTQDRLEDVISTRASAVPPMSVHLVPWERSTVGLIEIGRNPEHLPYTISRDLTEGIKEGDVFVRHGSHIARASNSEIADLVAEAKQARSQ